MSGCLKNNDGYFNETGFVGTAFVGDWNKNQNGGFLQIF